ncbi:hypothetical protein UMZ34_15160 [Halopseudomonas pachastrellae]|nr:hypothetical protein UMZ34_15160 [Halopseudomonas pachastrellae]
MVHGQRNGFGWLAPVLQHFDWTDGCIAITNAEMDEFCRWCRRVRLSTSAGNGVGLPQPR